MISPLRFQARFITSLPASVSREESEAFQQKAPGYLSQGEDGLAYVYEKDITFLTNTQEHEHAKQFLILQGLVHQLKEKGLLTDDNQVNELIDRIKESLHYHAQHIYRKIQNY